jgi:hypothetical protein
MDYILEIKRKIQLEKEKIFRTEIINFLKKIKLNKEILKKVKEAQTIKFKIKINSILAYKAELVLELDYEEEIILINYLPLLLIFTLLNKEFYLHFEEEKIFLERYISLEEAKKILKIKQRIKKIPEITISKEIWSVFKILEENIIKLEVKFLLTDSRLFVDDTVIYIHKDNLCVRIVLENEINNETATEILKILFT